MHLTAMTIWKLSAAHGDRFAKLLLVKPIEHQPLNHRLSNQKRKKGWLSRERGINSDAKRNGYAAKALYGHPFGGYLCGSGE